MYNLNNADVFVGVNTCTCHSVMWKYTNIPLLILKCWNKNSICKQRIFISTFQATVSYLRWKFSLVEIWKFKYLQWKVTGLRICFSILIKVFTKNNYNYESVLSFLMMTS